VSLSSESEQVKLFVDTAEDTIPRKLDWRRRGGETSERQCRDVVVVMNTKAHQLDQASLHEWAPRSETPGGSTFGLRVPAGYLPELHPA
jgi:hypothetical protein